MRRPSSQQGADSSSRLGDLTLRKPHYQTARASPVNYPKAEFNPSTNRNESFNARGLSERLGQRRSWRKKSQRSASRMLREM